ncbi:small ribosomal subunit protein uS7m [Halyomorpha halys]|uniref:small ribosomal subunit protein uS7m n=1 Tax=Halyomorpha halys TaxID=286706 RepID=UPI0006D50CAB|nr:28S ribosomal protein S7, mitochondrial [Halyomorpha halys]
MAQVKQLLSFTLGSTRRVYLPKLSVAVTREYSAYGPNFVEPVFRREDINKLKETGEAKTLAHIPIKAAKTEQTCSEFYDPQLERFINYVMRKGKKSLARSIVNQSLQQVKRIQIQKYHKETDPDEKAKVVLDPLKVFHAAVENCKPLLNLTPIKRGGATYQVPVPITPHKATFMSMNWLIEQGKAEPKTTRFHFKLANELVNASMGHGRVIKRKEDLHRQCEANRAYAHYI